MGILRQRLRNNQRLIVLFVLIVLVPSVFIGYVSIRAIRTEQMRRQFQEKEQQRSIVRMLDADLRDWLFSFQGGASSQAILKFQVDGDRISFPDLALTIPADLAKSPLPLVDRRKLPLPLSRDQVDPQLVHSVEDVYYPRIQAFLRDLNAGRTPGMQYFRRIRVFIVLLPDRKTGYVLDSQRWIEHANKRLAELLASEGYRGEIFAGDRGDSGTGTAPGDALTLANFPSLQVVFSRDQSSWSAFDFWNYPPAYIGMLVGIVVILGVVFLYRAVSQEMAATQLKSDFVSAVSHEFRTPLSSILVLSERLEGGRVTEGHRLLEYHRRIRQEAHRLSLLVNKLLDFAQIEEGRKEFRMEPSNLCLIAQETVRVFQDLDGGSRIQLQQCVRLQQCVSAGQAPVLADKIAVAHCVQNLIENALKYSPPGSPVTVRCGSENGTCFVEVGDEGAGIPASEHGKIFEKFYRIQNAQPLNVPGTGIGLALAKRIMESHKGRISLNSEPGKGSRFRLIFPRAEA